MRNLIVAREKEQAVLESLLGEPTAQMLAVYGRRMQKTVDIHPPKTGISVHFSD